MAVAFGLSLSAGYAQTETPAGAVSPQLVPRYTVRPGYHALETMHAQAAVGATIPLWSGQITDGSTYPFTMVGNSPLVTGNPAVATVNAVLYPVKFTFKNSKGKTLAVQDPTAADPACSPAGKPATLVENSPFFNNVANFTIDSVNIGTGQFTSLFQRANFWAYTGGAGGLYPGYQVNLALTVGKTIAVTETGAKTGIYPATVPCGKLTYVDINTWDKYVTGTLLKQLKVSPTTLPIFLFYNTVMIDNSVGNCCILGYHGSTGKTLQTYAVIDYDTTGGFGSSVADTSVMSHELGEWMDDPDGTNPTANWGHVGQVSGCQNNLEVGDPLSGGTLRTVPLGGFNYHVQDLAFFSWFYHQTPSIGEVSTYYSLYGTFSSPAAPCS